MSAALLLTAVGALFAALVATIVFFVLALLAARWAWEATRSTRAELDFSAKERDRLDEKLRASETVCQLKSLRLIDAEGTLERVRAIATFAALDEAGASHILFERVRRELKLEARR